MSRGEATYADWIAVDWGTSHLRCWAMRGNDAIAEAQSDKGMGVLKQAEFEAALLDLIAPWLGSGVMTVIACGMVGSRQGWIEAPYAQVPCKPLDDHLAQPCVSDARLKVRVIPGLKQMSPADVMRGEETQIAGYLVRNPGFDGVLCLPGTHTKWVQISAGEVVSFRTFMTGELFALIAGQSVLRHSIGKGWDDAAFGEAVADSMSKPEALASRFFSLRAESLLLQASGDAARARLSGLLIGAELAAARPYWLGQEIAIVGDAKLAAHYATALAAQGTTPHVADGTACTLAGLAAAHAHLKETTK